MTANEVSLDDPDAQAREAEALSRREKAKMEKENRDLTLKNLMLRAGLDPDDGMGQLLFKGYDGDLTKDAIVAAATAAGIIKDESTPPPDPGITPEERQSSQERQTAAIGSVPDGGITNDDMDPRVRAVAVGNEIMDAGGTQEAAMGAAFDEIASAAFNDKDSRAIWTAGKEDPRRPNQGW